MKRLPPPPADTPTFEQLRAALQRLEATTERRWGTMTAVQMVVHCRRFLDLYLGEVPVSGLLRVAARWLARPFLVRVLSKSPTRTPRNLRTLPALRSSPDATADLDPERERFLRQLAAIEAQHGTVDHPLYGSMASEDVHALVRHHTAHHFHQFGLLDPS